jgi:hypothetical protein
MMARRAVVAAAAAVVNVHDEDLSW